MEAFSQIRSQLLASVEKWELGNQHLIHLLAGKQGEETKPDFRQVNSTEWGALDLSLPLLLIYVQNLPHKHPSHNQKSLRRLKLRCLKASINSLSEGAIGLS